MEDAFVVDIAEIKRLTTRLFEVLESAGRARIKVSDTQHWTVFAADAFSLDEPSPVIGDLADDLEDARRELAAENEFDPVVWHASQHLAGLFQLIAHADLNGGFVTETEGATS